MTVRPGTSIVCRVSSVPEESCRKRRTTAKRRAANTVHHTRAPGTRSTPRYRGRRPPRLLHTAKDLYYVRNVILYTRGCNDQVQLTNPSSRRSRLVTVRVRDVCSRIHVSCLGRSEKRNRRITGAQRVKR